MGTAEYDNGGIISHFHFFHHSPHCFTFFEKVGRYLLALGHDQLIAFVIEQQYFLFPDLVYFAADNIAYTVSILFKQVVLFQVAYTGGERLLGGKNGAAAKIAHIHLLIYFLAYAVIRLYLYRFGIWYLYVL